MINKKNLALCFFSAFLLLGCSSKHVHKNDVVKEKQLLKQSPFDENVLYFMADDFNIKNYNKIEVEKILIVENESSKNVNKELKNKVSSYLQMQLQKRLSKVIKNNKNEKTLKLEIAISNIDVSYKDLAFYQYLPYGLAFTALKRGTGFEERKLNIQLALKLSDLENRKTQILLIDNSKPKDIKNYSALDFEKIKEQLDAWIDKYELRMYELNKGKYKK